MLTLNTIEAAHKQFQTNGSTPLLVTCNDFQDWVCKYDRSTNNLFNELLAAKFAAIWDIKIPETALIRVKREHVPLAKYPNIRNDFLEKECFGSLYIENSKEIDLSTNPLVSNKSSRDKISNKDDFLKIALFDIWLANEDRNYNNSNLLLVASPENSRLIYAIDHVNIFNSSSLDHGISEITADESILKTELAKILFYKRPEFPQIVDNFAENFYIWASECQNKLDKVLNQIPDSWKIDKEETKDRIVHNLFTEKWNQCCINNFKAFIQSFILH